MEDGSDWWDLWEWLSAGGGRGFPVDEACDWSELESGRGLWGLPLVGGVATEWAGLTGVPVDRGRGFVCDVACDWSEPRVGGA